MRKLFVLFLLVASSIEAQIDEARLITERLCSPEFHGRGYVLGGDSIAAAFLKDEFSKRGLQKTDGSFFQEYTFNVNTFPGRMLVKLDGKTIQPGIDFVIDPSSAGVKGKMFELEFLSKEQEVDPNYLVKMIQSYKVEGTKMCVFDLSHFTGDSLQMVKQIMYEVATVVPTIEQIDGKFTWSVGESQQFPLFLQIQRSVLEEKATITIDIDAIQKQHKSRNVIAYLPAKCKSKKKKTIVFTAHYDHLGRMGVDTYFPGANDNASGTSMLLYLADYFIAHPIDANILFIAFSGEEAGLRGSKYFVEHPTYPLNKIDFLINLDIMGSGEEGITVVNATLYEDAYNTLVELNEKGNFLKIVKKRGPAANSDHYWFTEKNVPAFFIYTMGPNKHYHDIEDTYAELSFSEFEDIGKLLVQFVNTRIEKR